MYSTSNPRREGTSIKDTSASCRHVPRISDLLGSLRAASEQVAQRAWDAVGCTSVTRHGPVTASTRAVVPSD